MKKYKDTIIQWLFIVLTIVPTLIMAKMRLHHRNFGLFVVLSVIAVAIVWFGYFVYLKKIKYEINSDEEKK